MSVERYMRKTLTELRFTELVHNMYRFSRYTYKSTFLCLLRYAKRLGLSENTAYTTLKAQGAEFLRFFQCSILLQCTTETPFITVRA